MFDLGWTELLLIGIVALIVVGPKDLPMLFRKVGKFVGKARGMAREFSRAMDDAADEAGVKEVSKTLKAASNPLQTSLDQVKKAATDFTQYNPESETGKLAADRAEAAKKIRDGSAKKAPERKAAEKVAAKKAAVKDAGEKSNKKPKKADTNASEASKD
jgi:sec-independent protein translocase protein TatB